ncbi:TolC family protein, partial [Escherichia coli]
MKSISILVAIALLGNSSVFANVCPLDIYFSKSIEYKTYQMQSEQNKMERQDNDYSLLPEISIFTGQSAYNKSSFKSPEYSSAGIYLSMPIYSGGRYFLNNDRLSLLDKLQSISIEKSRINYLLSIYEKITRRNEINYLLREYHLRQNDSDIENRRLQYLFEKGDVSGFELNLKRNMNEDSYRNIKLLKSELRLLEWSLNKEYHIPQNMFGFIDSSTIKLCKRNSLSSLIRKENITELTEANVNYLLEKSTDYPSLSLSLSIRPQKGGEIRNVSIQHGDYSASINLNIPLSGLLKQNTKKERYSHSVDSAKIKIDKKNMELESARENTLNKLDDATNELVHLRKQLSHNKNKINYLRKQLKENNNIVSYYDEINSLNEIERNLIKKENEIE